ncbi:hypothetical protein [Mesobacillus subterraneus]|uniref:Uncharacterized protein n=1 Tax=Mesobacillus subterraneus TaxID=285983 RepID=A0A427TWF9_9BACI|nr:hypothetical protein [Mesobacillus subterraneus]RSD28734.1 hypothetical protein EJA10_03935 [Mesobacillus subterraneus]
MKKILKGILWIGCIGLLSFAYEDYLLSEFYVQTSKGVVMDKGVVKKIKNTYGNFIEEKEYWMTVNNERFVISKGQYDGVELETEVKVSRTKHGNLIE